jgi:hypothetical protein
MKRRTVTSIQNIPDRNASRPSQSAARRGQRCRRPDWARNAAPVIAKWRRSRRPMTPRQFNFMPLLHAPSADASRRATRLGRTPHRTDGDQDGQIFWTGGASPPPNRDAQGVHRRIEAGQDGQIRGRRRQAMMTFAALVVAAILVASTLYAMFSRTR